MWDDVEWFSRCSLACVQANKRDGLQREEYLKIKVGTGRKEERDGRGYDRGTKEGIGRKMGRGGNGHLYSGSIPPDAIEPHSSTSIAHSTPYTMR